jgi:hypothetical protein
MFILIKDRERQGHTLLNLDNVIEIYEVCGKDSKFTRFRCIDDSHVDVDETLGIVLGTISKLVI